MFFLLNLLPGSEYHCLLCPSWQPSTLSIENFLQNCAPPKLQTRVLVDNFFTARFPLATLWQTSTSLQNDPLSERAISTLSLLCHQSSVTFTACFTISIADRPVWGAFLHATLGTTTKQTGFFGYHNGYFTNCWEVAKSSITQNQTSYSGLSDHLFLSQYAHSTQGTAPKDAQLTPSSQRFWIGERGPDKCWRPLGNHFRTRSSLTRDANKQPSRGYASVWQSLSMGRDKAAACLVDASMGQHHLLCPQLRAAQGKLTFKEKDFSALTASYNRSTNGRRRRASNTEEGGEHKRGRVTVFFGAVPFPRRRHEEDEDHGLATSLSSCSWSPCGCYKMLVGPRPSYLNSWFWWFTRLEVSFSSVIPTSFVLGRKNQAILFFSFSSRYSFALIHVLITFFL